ncbi:MAG: hypothetical protein JNN32_07775 [Flavobacteriales bacterium]|nr:hypothetical protein [Flavobacteriales bacterium]
MLTRLHALPFVLCCALTATAQVPALLRDINPTSGSNVGGITCVDGLVFFSANDGTTGAETWVSDGTPSGTQLLKDINPGAAGSGPVSFLGWNDRVYFAADNGVDGYQLWSTDGTTAGTQVELTVDNVQDLESASRFTVYGDIVIFRGETEATGAELWRTDGTVEGTQLILDINPGTFNSDPREFKVYDGRVYFSAYSPGIEQELWVTDGTAEGTQLVKDIDEEIGSSTPRDLTVVNDLLFFKASDGYAHDAELWATDGTSEGTYMVRDIVTGGNGSLPQNLVALGNAVWFSAYDGTRTKLWHSDGTAAGTLSLDTPVELFSEPDHLVAHGGYLYFSGYINGSDQQLFRTDGTVEGTEHIVMPGSVVNGPLYPTNVITSCGDHLFFAANYDAAVGAEPYTLLSPVTVIEGQETERTRLYPVPTTDRLHLTNAPANAVLRLYATDGRSVFERPATDMDIRELPPGLYLARLTLPDGTTVLVQQVVKE